MKRNNKDAPGSARPSGTVGTGPAGSLRSGMEGLISFPRMGSAPNQKWQHKRLQLESAMPEGPAPRRFQFEGIAADSLFVRSP